MFKSKGHLLRLIGLALLPVLLLACGDEGEGDSEDGNGGGNNQVGNSLTLNKTTSFRLEGLDDVGSVPSVFTGTIQHPDSFFVETTESTALSLYSDANLAGRLADENPFRSENDFVLLLYGDAKPAYGGLSALDIARQAEAEYDSGLVPGQQIIERPEVVTIGSRDYIRFLTRGNGVSIVNYMTKVGETEVFFALFRASSISRVEPSVRQMLATLQVGAEGDGGSPPIVVTPVQTPR